MPVIRSFRRWRKKWASQRDWSLRDNLAKAAWKSAIEAVRTKPRFGSFNVTVPPAAFTPISVMACSTSV